MDSPVAYGSPDVDPTPRSVTRAHWQGRTHTDTPTPRVHRSPVYAGVYTGAAESSPCGPCIGDHPPVIFDTSDHGVGGVVGVTPRRAHKAVPAATLSSQSLCESPPAQGGVLSPIPMASLSDSPGATGDAMVDRRLANLTHRVHQSSQRAAELEAELRCVCVFSKRVFVFVSVCACVPLALSNALHAPAVLWTGECRRRTSS